MTDKQRLAKLQQAEAALKRTTEGYRPGGVHWRTAMQLIDAVQEDLREPPPPKIPNLGPAVAGGKSVLLLSLTHNTDGISLYPAVDLGWRQGVAVLAPERLTVTRQSSASGADAFYAEGKIDWWFGHITQAPQDGRVFNRGDKMGEIAWIPQGQGGPHLHVGVNVERLLGAGRQLKYGRDGNGPDYTYGAKTVGVQLRAAL